MLYPSIDTLLKEVGSKYSIVIVASKRGRQLLDRERKCHREADELVCPQKYIGISLEEIANGTLEVTS